MYRHVKTHLLSLGWSNSGPTELFFWHKALSRWHWKVAVWRNKYSKYWLQKPVKLAQKKPKICRNVFYYQLYQERFQASDHEYFNWLCKLSSTQFCQITKNTRVGKKKNESSLLCCDLKGVNWLKTGHTFCFLTKARNWMSMIIL